MLGGRSRPGRRRQGRRRRHQRGAAERGQRQERAGVLGKGQPSPREPAERHAGAQRLGGDEHRSHPHRGSRQAADARHPGAGEPDEQRLDAGHPEPRPGTEVGAEEVLQPAQQREQEREAEQQAVAESGARFPVLHDRREHRERDRRDPPQVARGRPRVQHEPGEDGREHAQPDRTDRSTSSLAAALPLSALRTSRGDNHPINLLGAAVPAGPGRKRSVVFVRGQPDAHQTNVRRTLSPEPPWANRRKPVERDAFEVIIATHGPGVLGPERRQIVGATVATHCCRRWCCR